MAHIVTVTIAGGAYLGPLEDTPISINVDRVMKIEDTQPDEVGASVITMDDNSRYWVTESQTELQTIINA